MNITELDSYNLADAVKFHNRLNPKIWGQDERLLPEVRQKLLEIAADFQEFLGIDDLAVEDITVSGSNAAYSYTPHSDIDLHLVVSMPQDDEVYQELFNAKKYQYNDLMDIKIHGADVELYVQPADEAPVSLGEYSIKNDDWIQVPRRKRAKIDHSVVKHKYEDLKARIESALKEDDSERVQALIDKIKAMRQSGLDAHGEFGAENLAFKMLRSQGYIKKLYDHRAATRARELSLREQNKPRQKFRYGFSEGHQGHPYSSEDGVAPTTAMFVTEDDSAEDVVRDFINNTAQRLGIETMPEIQLHSNDDWSVEHHSFGMYEPETHTLHVNLNDRHILDILRTTAHELVHCRQNELSKLPAEAGETGSRWENEAHAVAGEIMRDYADANPERFKEAPVSESASGYIPKNKKEARDPRYKMAVTVDVGPGQVGKEANKLALNTGRNGEPGLLMKSANLRESLEAEFALFESGQDLFEIKMSPSNLRQEAAKTGAMAGMEFEMIVPNVNVEIEPDYEMDMDQDQRSRDFDDIRQFFYDGDYNSRRDVDRLIQILQEEFAEWGDEQIEEAWLDEGFDYMREYIETNGYWDESEAEEEITNALQAEYGDDISPEDFEKMLNAMAKEKFDEFVQDQWDNQGQFYDEARDQYLDEQRAEQSEREWLDEKYPYMSDIQSNFDISWPYYYDANQGDGEMDIERIADDFSDAVGMKVNWSANYHGGRREPNAYVVEPDGSLEADDSDDGGLEFVSPPMPIDRMIEQLNTVKEWAGRNGCYTNSSTGLHINISVPNYTLAKLDYVKLALLLGDRYVLDQFGRSSNTYTKSALGKVQDLIKRNPDTSKQLLDKMRGHMEDLATKAIHAGTTDKYTSINTKSGYIEFRSPGGDWLDENFSKIENTLLRFTVALSAAINPEAYREEYLKKLYKLLEPVAVEREKDTIKFFADYVAGKTPKAALRSFVKQAQLERKIKRGDVGGEEFKWEVGRPGYGASIIVVAKTKEGAIDRALQPDGYPDWANARNQLTATPIGPANTAPVRATAGEPQAVGRASGPTVGGRASNPEGAWILAPRGENPPVPLYRFNASGVDDANTVLAQWQQEHPGDAVDVHYDPQITRGQPPIPGSTLDRQRQRAAAQAAGQQGGNWGIWLTGENRFSRAPGQPDNSVLRRFPSREAAEQWIEQTRATNPALRPDIEVREIEPAAQQSDSGTEYIIFNINDRSQLTGFRAANQAAAEREAESILRDLGLDPDNYDVRERHARPTPTQNSLPGGPSYTIVNDPRTNQQSQPLGAGRELVGWSVRLENGQEVTQLRGIGNNQGDANRIAHEWILRQPAAFLRQHQGQGIEVVPIWGEA